MSSPDFMYVNNFDVTDTLQKYIKMKAFWASPTNFGDAVTKYIITHLSGSEPEFIHISRPAHKFLVTGSVLGTRFAKYATSWGCGVANINDEIGLFHKCIMTRGPISYKLAKRSGNKVQLYGDPVLLMPNFYKPGIVKTHKIGIIPSWVDYKSLKWLESDEIKVINIMTQDEKFVDELLSVEETICGSLHALVASIAYNIPTRWVRFSNKIIGDGTKFKDFFQSIGHNEEELVYIGLKNKNKLYNITKHYDINLDLKAIYDSNPFSTFGQMQLS